MPITIDGSGTITGASTLATTVASPTLTTPNINSAQFATVSGTAPIYAARAWVNFNGSGTVAIRASGNVSSITDNSTGNYTVNFTTAMPDVDYASVYGQGDANSSNGVVIRDAVTAVTLTRTVSAMQFQATNSAITLYVDATRLSVAVFR